MALLLLFLASMAAASPIPRSDDQGGLGSCDDLYSCRKLSSIAWSCINTIFLCTWVAFHPNIPYPVDTSQMSFWGKFRHNTGGMFRKVGYWLSALLAPELVLGFAMAELMRVRWRVKENQEKLALTKVQGFFIIMGGFYSIQNPDQPESEANPPARKLEPEQVIRLLDSKTISLPSEEEIKDKGKSDWIAKTLVVIQLSWFTIQCIARAIEHLTITEFETVTLAYAVVTFGMYVVWWDKPSNINCPIRVPNNLIDFSKPVQKDSREETEKILPASTWDSKREEYIAATIMISIGTALGAVHFIPWSSEFPSHKHQVLWRLSSIIMVLFPVTLILDTFIVKFADAERFRGSHVKSIFKFIGFTLLFATFLIYAFARATTLVLALIDLKYLPSVAYKDVEWTSFLPHL